MAHAYTRCCSRIAAHRLAAHRIIAHRLAALQVETQKKDARFGTWTVKEIDVLNELNLLTAKKGIYLVNMSEKDYLRKKNKHLVPIHKWLQEEKEGEKMVLYSAAVEAKLVGMSQEDKDKYFEEYKTKSMMGKIVQEGCVHPLISP